MMDASSDISDGWQPDDGGHRSLEHAEWPLRVTTDCPISNQTNPKSPTMTIPHHPQPRPTASTDPAADHYHPPRTSRSSYDGDLDDRRCLATRQCAHGTGPRGRGMGWPARRRLAEPVGRSVHRDGDGGR